MNALWLTLRRVAADLAATGHEFALVGGLATSSITEPRFTRDVDIAVAVPSDAAAESLVRALLASGYRATTIVEQEATGRLSTVRLAPPADLASGAVVDLLFASCGIEPEIVRDATTTTLVSGLRVPVARCGHLIAMKLLATAPSRPQDHVDLVGLLEHADAAELDRARTAIRLIDERGFARGRDLGKSLDDLIRSRDRRGR